MKPVSKGGLLVPSCPYCGFDAILRHTLYGRVWECPMGDCDARVGVHKGSKRAAPLGTLARAPLRLLRMQAHALLDPLWHGAAPRFTRKQVYAELAERLGVPFERCHIGEFDDELCARAIAILEEGL